jgi:antitoxin (DNA-binding transcriptional repressor) of toxin-antitoxin stability system
MQTVEIRDFETNLLKYLELANSGEIISVTSEGKLLATIMPPENKKETAIKQLKLLSETAVVDDVVNPIESDWNVLK